MRKWAQWEYWAHFLLGGWGLGKCLANALLNIPIKFRHNEYSPLPKRQGTLGKCFVLFVGSNNLIMETTNQPPLNEIQLTLLRLFSREMSSDEMTHIKQLLMDYYEKELQKELDEVIADKNLNPADFEERLNQQQRSSH